MARQATLETQLFPGNEDDEDSYDDMEAAPFRCLWGRLLAFCLPNPDVQSTSVHSGS